MKGHCRFTGKYLGPIHDKCNLYLKFPDKILVICHNSTNYDTHFFIKNVCKKYKEVKLIATTDENI